MRTKGVITLLLAAIVLTMAQTPLRAIPHGRHGQVVDDDTTFVPHNQDSLFIDTIMMGNAIDDSISVDTLNMDSLQLAIYHHNKAVDDSLRLDSINRAKPNGIDSPVTFTAEDCSFGRFWRV